ncbi:MAG: LysE family translocator [Pseudomonadota bacterium]
MDLMVSLGMIILVNFLAWITPGPNMFAVMAASLEHGRRHGMATGLGLSCGAFLWATLAVLGVAILFDLFPKAVLALKLIGAAYLIWLGLRSLKSAMQDRDGLTPAPGTARSALRSLLTGFTVSMTNPKAALFFGSVMTTFIPAVAPGWFFVLVVVLCGGLAVIFHAMTATLFSTRVAIGLFRRFKRAISVTFGAVFIALGGSIAVAALRRS